MASSGQPHPAPPPPPASGGGGGGLVYDHDEDQQIQEHQENQENQSTATNTLHAAGKTEEKCSATQKSIISTWLLGVNYMCLFLGSVSATLLTKFYFNHKGNSRWVSTWVQCAGFPLLLFPIYFPYYIFKCSQRKPFSGITSKILTLSIVVGFLLGLNNLLFSWGSSYLPVSTFSLLLSCQLAFTLICCVIIVKQKITFSNLNCVVLLTLSSVLLALGSDHDKPKGINRGKYFVGYFSGIGAGLLFSLYLPVMEKIYRKFYCYSMVMEMQLIMEISATILATTGMAVDRGFSDMKAESLKVFDLGTKAYWLTIFFQVITWQLCFMGTAGMVFLTSSLTGGICMTALMAINVLGGVLVYGDEFGGVKIVSTLLCVWGFSSYLFGLYIKTFKKQKTTKQRDERIISQSNRQLLEMSEIV